MTLFDWLFLVGFFGVLIWGIDRALLVREIEISMKEHLGDLLVARDATDSKVCRCCCQSRIYEIKTLIRKHFTL